MKFTNLKKFLASVTLSAMSFGIVGCSPAGAIITMEHLQPVIERVDQENPITRQDRRTNRHKKRLLGKMTKLLSQVNRQGIIQRFLRACVEAAVRNDIPGDHLATTVFLSHIFSSDSGNPRHYPNMNSDEIIYSALNSLVSNARDYKLAKTILEKLNHGHIMI